MGYIDHGFWTDFNIFILTIWLVTIKKILLMVIQYCANTQLRYFHKGSLKPYNKQPKAKKEKDKVQTVGARNVHTSRVLMCMCICTYYWWDGKGHVDDFNRASLSLLVGIIQNTQRHKKTYLLPTLFFHMMNWIFRLICIRNKSSVSSGSMPNPTDSHFS